MSNYILSKRKPNVGDRGFIIGNRFIPIQNSKPYKTKLNYLESTGTQWIDTGIIPVSNLRTVIQLKILSGAGDIIPVGITQVSGQVRGRYYPIGANVENSITDMRSVINSSTLTFNIISESFNIIDFNNNQTVSVNNELIGVLTDINFNWDKTV